MLRAMGSVSINSAQGNPLQLDVQFRGFTASPLLGLPQGLAVYQDGARINEPFGDSVNWDLLPESAVASITLAGGANPVYGLNTLGGALVVDMKTGFSYQGHELEASTGCNDIRACIRQPECQGAANSTRTTNNNGRPAGKIKQLHG